MTAIKTFEIFFKAKLMKKYINIPFPNARTCKNAWSKKQVNNPSKSPTGLILLRFHVFNKPDFQPFHSYVSLHLESLKERKLYATPTQYMGRCTEFHRKYKIWSWGLSCADFEIDSHSDWVFPSSGSGRSTNKPMENQLIKQKKCSFYFHFRLGPSIIIFIGYTVTFQHLPEIYAFQINFHTLKHVHKSIIFSITSKSIGLVCLFLL